MTDGLITAVSLLTGAASENKAVLFYPPEVMPSLSLCLTPPLFTDMPIFGQCPAQDDFYLVMCSQCGHVVKPQAFQAHYGKCGTLSVGLLFVHVHSRNSVLHLPKVP